MVALHVDNIVDIVHVAFSQHQFKVAAHYGGLCMFCEHGSRFDSLLQLRVFALACISTTASVPDLFCNSFNRRDITWHGCSTC